jgi:hypothetical protein
MSVADCTLPSEAVSCPPAPAPRRRRLLLHAAGVAAAGLALLLALPRPHEVSPDATSSAELIREEARRGLSAFLAASTPEQRAECVVDGERLLPLMEAYYAGREVDPLAAGDFQPASWSFNTESPDRTALELPRGRSLPAVMACMKKAGSGRWLVDWEIWTQSLDGRFREFLTRPSEGASTLRVRLTAASVSQEQVKLEVSDPFTTGSSLALETPRADLVALFSADLPEGTTRTATVQLVWLNDSLSGTLRPVLRRHICWGFQGLDGIEAIEREPARARRHHPPLPVPASGSPLIDSVVEAERVIGAPGVFQAPENGLYPVTGTAKR